MPNPKQPHKPDEDQEEEDVFAKGPHDDDMLADEDADPMEDTDLEIDEDDPEY